MKLILMTCLLVFSYVTQSLAQEVTTIPHNGLTVEDGLAIAKDGTVYASNYNKNQVQRFDSTGTVTTFTSAVRNPNGLTLDEVGNLYVVNQGEGQVLKITPEGKQTVLVKDLPMPAGIAFDRNQVLHVTSYSRNQIYQVAKDGTTQVFKADLYFDGPVGIAFDEDNVMYVGSFNSGRIIKVDSTGNLTKIAQIPGDKGFALGFITYGNGAIYASAITRHKIYKIRLDGQFTDFVGTGTAGKTDGLVTEAQFDGPNGLAMSPDGTALYVTDYNTKVLRKVVLSSQK